MNRITVKGRFTIRLPLGINNSVFSQNKEESKEYENVSILE